jgi:hypothetical protein
MSSTGIMGLLALDLAIIRKVKAACLQFKTRNTKPTIAT